MSHKRQALSATERLKTLDLYLKMQSVKEVADELGLSDDAVIRRLESVGIWKRPHPHGKETVEEANGGPERVEMLRQKVLVKIEAEKANNPEDHGLLAAPTHPAQLLKTLLLYKEHQNSHTVGKLMKISPVTVGSRITGLNLKMRPLGRKVSFEEANKPGAIEEAIRKLKEQIK